MKLILIDGGPASGKNTLGTLLVKKLRTGKENIVLLDLDTYVEALNPTWIWSDKRQEQEDQLKARMNLAKEIDSYLNTDHTVVVVGERWLTKDDIILFLKRLKTVCPTFLFHLNIPFEIRKRRLEERGPHSLIDLEKDQNERDKISNWPGYVYQNFNLPDEDADNLIQLLKDSKGRIDIDELIK